MQRTHFLHVHIEHSPRYTLCYWGHIWNLKIILFARKSKHKIGTNKVNKKCVKSLYWKLKYVRQKLNIYKSEVVNRSWIGSLHIITMCCNPPWTNVELKPSSPIPSGITYKRIYQLVIKFMWNCKGYSIAKWSWKRT